MISTGTLSTTKEVFNPVTKKMENKIVTTPGFSAEKAAATVEKAIRQATPEDVARKERVDFTGWLFETLGGR
jgi:trehalose-6-phosphatase